MTTVYGNVVVRFNIFTSGPNAEHALSFAPGGDTILISDNVFSGPVRSVPVPQGCENLSIRNNAGITNFESSLERKSK